MKHKSNNIEVKSITSTLMDRSKTSRESLTKKEVIYFGRQSKTAGLLFINYANMILNRIIDLFDDSVFLLDRGMLSSACIISRCLMETHAMGMFVFNEVNKIITKNDLDLIENKILEFINSSKIKVIEQEALKKNKFSLDDFQFTEQAKKRMLSEAATSIHIMNAMRTLFSAELNQSGKKESIYELAYNYLSEWVHPSQSSLFHQYAKETQKIETSIGMVSLDEAKKNNCAVGLSLIQEIGTLHNDMSNFGGELHKLCVNTSKYC